MAFQNVSQTPKYPHPHGHLKKKCLKCFAASRQGKLAREPAVRRQLAAQGKNKILESQDKHE